MAGSKTTRPPVIRLSGPPAPVRKRPLTSAFRPLMEAARRTPGQWVTLDLPISVTKACGRLTRIKKNHTPEGYAFTVRSKSPGASTVFCRYEPRRGK